MNIIIIYSAGIILKIKPHLMRTIISGTIGSVYAIILYLIQIKIYTSIVSKIVLSIIMVYIAYNPQNIIKMLKQLLIFYLTSFVFGGISLYLIYCIKPQEILMKNGMYAGQYILKTILLSSFVGIIIIRISINIIKTKINPKDMFCKIKLKLKEKEVETKAMIDTGNLVKEPITNTPVIIVEKNILYNIISKEILDNIDNILEGNLDKITDIIKKEYMSKLRYIPFKSLGKENGMLLGIKADEIEIETEGELKKSKNIIIGIYDKTLSKKGEYSALIGMDFL